jgi:signal transduction histidine kinase
MISRLDVSFAQMKQFSADASHELLTPLSVLRSQLETALNSRVEGDEMKKIIADCLDETLHMTSILGNLLLLAQGDAKSIVTSRDPVDLTALMNEMHEESVVLASQKSITVSVNIIPGVTITGDRPRLRQMLLNLIDNAIKYNQVHGSIHLGLQVKDGNAVITVRDTGIGMSENEIPKIFNRFYRVDRARSRELGGAGLGLSIVKWIVDAHNGTISVISKVNGGTEFLVSFPLDPLYPGA